MSKTPSFEELPKDVSDLKKDLNKLTQIILKHFNSEIEESKDKILDIQGASSFLNLSIATIYSKVSKGELPYMKRSKRLYFSSIDLMNYLKKGRVKSNSEIEDEVEKYLSKKK